MRKLLLGVAAVGLLAASPAIADVKTKFDVDSYKKKKVLELVLKLKAGLFIVGVLDEAEAMAESVTLVNQRNYDNKACENCAEKRSLIGAAGEDVENDSLSGNSGVISVNQSTGNMNNQGTAISFSINEGPASNDPDNENDTDAISSWADSLAAVGQLNYDNRVVSEDILFRDSTIQNSGTTNSGLLYVNQSAGNMNNQANALSAAVSDPTDGTDGDDNSGFGGVALSEADLGQINTNNVVRERRIEKNADILGSFNTNTGIIGVNQASGNFANQANVVSLAITQ